jgi:undecaprenyl-diphosphatase
VKDSNKDLLCILVLTGLLALLTVLLLSGTVHVLIKSVAAAETRLFFAINCHHAPFWDGIMYAASDKLFWLPFYFLIVCYLIKAFKIKCWQPLVVILLLIVASDQLSSHLIKDSVMRLRPSHESALVPYIHLSKAGPGGKYGFVSSHAANAAALAVFLILLLDNRYRPLK